MYFSHLYKIQDKKTLIYFAFYSNSRTFDFIESRLHLGNIKKKHDFILYFARFALPLHPQTKISRDGAVGSSPGS